MHGQSDLQVNFMRVAYSSITTSKMILQNGASVELMIRSMENISRSLSALNCFVESSQIYVLR